MISYNEIIPGRHIVLESEPYEVVFSQISKKSRQKASNQTKLRNLISGKVVDRAFHQSDSIEEAGVEKRDITFLYTKMLPSGGSEHWFCEKGNPRNRFNVSEEVVQQTTSFLVENTNAEALYFNNRIVSIRPPIKMDLNVSEAPPAVRGNTSQGGTKQVVLETGLVITAPLFINEGDTVRVNTRTGEYVERVSKA